MKKKYYKFFILFLLFISFYLINPKVTEFAQFGGVLAGYQEIKIDNWMLVIIDEFSSQIAISSLFTIIFNSGVFTEFLGGLLQVSIAIIAIYHWIRLFDNSFKIKKNNLKIFLIIIIFYIFEYPFNLSYPIKFPLSYAVFGNSGMWFSLMVIGLILRNKLSGYFFYGILTGWHLVWFSFTSIIFFLKKNIDKAHQKLSLIKKIFATGLGIIITLILYFFSNILKNEIYVNLNITSKYYNFLDILRPEILKASKLTAHNIALTDYSFFIKIILIVIYGLYLFNNIKKLEFNIKFYKEIIIKFSFLGFFLTLYVAIGTYIPLLGSEIIARGIPNRVFNLLIIINSLLACYYLFFFIEKNLNIKQNFQSILLTLTWLIIAHQITGLAIVSVFIFKELIYKKIKFNIFQKIESFFFISLLLLIFSVKVFILNKYYYTIYDYVIGKDEIIKALNKIETKDSRIMVGPNIPPAHGFNIYLASPIEFVTIMAKNNVNYFKKISEISNCNKNIKNNIYFKLELDWNCMANLSASKWREIGIKTDITHVLALNNFKEENLQIEMIAKSKHFILYKLKKN